MRCTHFALHPLLQSSSIGRSKNATSHLQPEMEQSRMPPIQPTISPYIHWILDGCAGDDILFWVQCCPGIIPYSHVFYQSSPTSDSNASKVRKIVARNRSFAFEGMTGDGVFNACNASLVACQKRCKALFFLLTFEQKCIFFFSTHPFLVPFKIYFGLLSTTSRTETLANNNSGWPVHDMTDAALLRVADLGGW